MDSKIWFVYHRDIVAGPFDTEAVKQQIAAGRWSEDTFIWWKGQREWMPIRLWESQLAQILRTETDKSQSAIWYVDTTGSPVGPLTQTEMLSHLHGIKNPAKVRLWSVGMNKWTNLFELHEIMDHLGMSRREHDRAPLMGTVAISRMSEDATAMIARAASISVGGMGINDGHGLTRGDNVQLVIKSSEFAQPIRTRATTVYVTAQGFAGLRFANTAPEALSLIHDYVRKFNQPVAMEKARSA